MYKDIRVLYIRYVLTNQLVIPYLLYHIHFLFFPNNDINLSTDAGQTWIHQNVEQKFPWRYCRGIKQQVNNPEILYLGNGDGPPGSKGAMFRSQDGAQNWDKLQLPVMPNSTIWDYAVHPSDHNLVYAYSCSGEVYQSGDAGNTWTKFAQEFGEIRSLMWVPSKE